MKNMRMISPLENVYQGSSQEDVRCTESVKQEQNNPQPMFGPYQLIGDSLFVRFAEHILQQPSKIVNGSRSIGYCIGGQRIDQLRKRVKEGSYPLIDQIMVLIGTNDVLCGGEPKVMIKHFKRLLRVLKQKSVRKVIIITLPPIPKLCVSFSHWGIIRKYNEFLMTLKNERSMDIEVLDVLPIFTIFRPALEFKITEADLTFNPSNSLERNSSLETKDYSEVNSEKRNSVKNRSSWSETPISRESSSERKMVVQSYDKVSKQMAETITNENSTPTFENAREFESFRIEDVKQKDKEVKYNASRQRMVPEYSSDSINENENDASLSEDCDETQNFEKFHQSQETLETTVINKGIKRFTDTDAHDDDEIITFNRALSRNSSKKRKIEIVPSVKPLSPEPKQVRKFLGSNEAQTSMFLKTCWKARVHSTPVLEGFNMQILPEKKMERLLDFKEEPETEGNEFQGADDSWAVDADEENFDLCPYFSQEEEVIDYDTKSKESENEDENEVLKEMFAEYLNSTNKSHFPKPKEDDTESKVVQITFPDFLKSTNDSNFVKTSPPIADQEMYSPSEIESEDVMENFSINVGCSVSEGEIENESSEEEEAKDDSSEGGTEDNSCDDETKNDLSESETKDDLSDDGGEKGEAETESESEVVTTDDEVRKRQITPIVDSKFIDYLKSIPKYSHPSDRGRSMDYLNKSYSYESSGYLSPSDNSSCARTVPYAMDKILYGGLSRGPYSHSMTPPFSASTSPDLDKICEPSESSYDCLLPREKSIMEYSRRICDVNYYEEFYTVGSKRMDMIHLNHAGLVKLQNFIEDQNIFF